MKRSKKASKRSLKKKQVKRSVKKAPKKSAPKKRKPTKKRSAAAKEAAAKRASRKRIIEQMRDTGWKVIDPRNPDHWEEVTELMTGEELYEYMEWMADLYGTTIGKMYEMSYGYPKK